MQITVDTTKDEKEDIQKAIEILTHFLNKQPKTNIVVQNMQQQNQLIQKSQQLQQPLQQQVRLQQAIKPAQQQVPRVASQMAAEQTVPRNEIRQLDPDLNNAFAAKNIQLVSQKTSNQDPETEDFLNRMLDEIDKTDGKDNEDFSTLKEKEVVRVPFGSTEVVKRQQQKQQQEEPEFTFEDLEKY